MIILSPKKLKVNFRPEYRCLSCCDVPLSLSSLPQEDSDYERERTPPTPPPRKHHKRGPFKLACIGKQGSDENPLVRKIATPLKLAQAQVNKYLQLKQHSVPFT